MILVLFRSLTHFIVGDGSPTLFSGYILAVELAEFDGLDGWCEKRGVKDDSEWRCHVGSWIREAGVQRSSPGRR